MNRRDLLKKVFRFHPGWVIGTALSLGFTMALANRFPDAYILFALCLIWAEGMWLTSDYLFKARVKSEKPPAKRRRFSDDEIAAIMCHKRGKYRFQKWGWCAGIAALALACFAFVARRNYEWDLQQNFGVLTPAHDPMPPVPCRFIQPTPSAIRVYAGGGLFWTNSDHFSLVSVGGRPIIFAGLQDGKMEISGDVYSPDGDLVHIDGNKFETLAGFKPGRPDRHTLIVWDKWHQKVLDIRFLNPHAIRLSGEFRAPGHAPVIIDDDDIKVGSLGSFSASCSSGISTAISVP